jgi:uncharacterized membrane protein YhaH (DUF805 family)
MKMSDYNWNWWFVLTIIVLFCGLLVAMVGNNQSEIEVGNNIIIISIISLVPCLYIGCKPEKK